MWDPFENLGQWLPCRHCGVIKRDVGYLTIPEKDGVRRRVIALCTPCAEESGLEEPETIELTDADLVSVLEEP